MSKLITFIYVGKLVVSVPDTAPTSAASLEAQTKGVYIPPPVFNGTPAANGNVVGPDGYMTVNATFAPDVMTFVASD